MNATTKLDIQLTLVDSAMPLARARRGNTSAPRSHGIGPQLEREKDVVRLGCFSMRWTTSGAYVAPNINR